MGRKQNCSAGLVTAYFSQVVDALQVMSPAPLLHIVRLLEDVRDRKGHVFLLGNGGSAATASHFCSDLSKGAMVPGKPGIKAQALTDSIPLLTAWANDTSYEAALGQRLSPWAEPGDVVIAISGSGNSPNILKAVSVAKAQGATTVGLTGRDGGKLREMVDICVIVPTESMDQIEDVHLMIAHIITSGLRNSGLEPRRVSKMDLSVPSAKPKGKRAPIPRVSEPVGADWAGVQ